MTTPIALTIAGSDSSGGAGIQADLKSFAALGVYGASVITALTAQNTRGVTGIHQVPPDFVTAQIDAVFSDLAVDAVKIGMVAQLATIDAIAAGLKHWRPKHVVLDPVMVATSGDRLLAADAVEALRTKLIPRAALVTPNLPEAAALLDEPVAASEAEILAVIERFAPEHLSLQVADPETFVPHVRRAGAIFVGDNTPVASGDYLAGTNHTLPTKRAGRYTGGLWVGKFLKTCSYQQVSPQASVLIGEYCSRLCAIERFWGHKKQADLRVRRYSKTVRKFTSAVTKERG